MPLFGANAGEDYAILNYLHSQVMFSSRQGTWGQRDPKTTKAALARPYRSAFGKELYDDDFQKAAALLDAIANNVVFRDGNKRTAIAAVSLFLALNGKVLAFGTQECDWFMYQVVVARPTINQIADWLKQHTKQTHLT